MPGAEGYINDPPAAVDADSTNETNDSVIALLKAIKNLQIDITELNLILAGAVSAGKVQCDTELTITGEGLATETTISDVKTAVEALAVATPDTAAGDLASISADLGTMQADIALMKADLADVETLLRTTGITLLPLDSSLDSIDVDKMTKGAITTAHSAITDTATSAEIDCRGFNSLLVHFVSDAINKTWTISVLGAMGSGLTFVPLLDKATGLAASEITTDISGFFVISNIPDYIKIVATKIDDGATVTCKVQPFNS